MNSTSSPLRHSILFETLTKPPFPPLYYNKPMLVFPPKPSLFLSSLEFLPKTQIHPKFLSGYPRILPVITCRCQNSGFSVSDDESEAELDRLVALLPEEMRCRLRKHPELDKLIELVMDLGRRPLARFPSGDFELSDCPVKFHDIEFATSQVCNMG